MAFEYQPPRYQVDPNQLDSGINALGQGVQAVGQRFEKDRVRQQGLNITNALSRGDYAGAMGATDNPELATRIAAMKAQRSDAADARAFRDREFMLRQQEAARQASQFQQSFGLQQKAENRQQEQFDIDHTKRLAELYGGVAQLVQQEPDDSKSRNMWQRIVRSHPEMAKKLKENGVDITDHRGGAQFLIAQARGYQQPEPGKINIVPEGGTAILTDPRTGQIKVIAQGGPKPLREHETKDAMWAERLERSNAIIDNVAGTDSSGRPLKGSYNPAQSSNRFWPDDGYMGMMNSSGWQQYQQAAREGIAAMLRKDTGAAVTKEEWNLYFPMLYPQPGDSPAVVAQKTTARQAAAMALKNASGPAFDRMFGPGMPRVGAPAKTTDVKNMSDEELLKSLGAK